MSKEYGMDDDTYDWQQRKDRKEDKPNGAPVSLEENSVDVVPDVTKAKFIHTAIAVIENPELVNTFEQRRALFVKALAYALRVQPSAKARELLLDDPYTNLQPLPATEPNGVTNGNGNKKFMTLKDIPPQRQLVAAG